MQSFKNARKFISVRYSWVNLVSKTTRKEMFVAPKSR